MDPKVTNRWVDVNLEGLSKLMVDRHPSFAVLELLQNSLDADGVKTVTIALLSDPARPHLATLVVQDDSPDGFHDLTHAYTLFAESEKKADPTKRGRFNLGEKLVLAICEDAIVTSTTGCVEFKADGTREETEARRETGSAFVAVIRMTKREVDETLAILDSVIIPDNVAVMVNGDVLRHRKPVLSFDVVLPTMRETPDGFRKTDRKTTVSVYEPLPGEKARIFELGIPVVETGDRYDVDIAQKVPLNMDRDNVTPGFLRTVRAFVLNETAARLTADEATATWATDALSARETTPETAATIVDARFGENAVRYDPSDPEANKIAASKGYTVVHGGSFTGAQWGKINEAGKLPRAGAVTPSPTAILGDPNGTGPSTLVSEDKWTPGMRQMVAYTKALAAELLGFEPDVEVRRLDIGQNVAAYWSNRAMGFNLTRLGHRWFNEPDQAKVDALLLHEFGHHFSGDHFDRHFIDAVADLGAAMRHVRIGLCDFAPSEATV